MMTNQWKEGQMRGFTVWCNLKLNERSLHIESLTELHDGVLLISLIEILSGKKIDGWVARPENKKIVKVNNVTLALQALSEIGIPISGISAAAFVDGDVSCTLALIWSIIQHYQLDHGSFGAGVTGSTYNAKLLNWLKNKLSGYELQIESLKHSFKDGLCFCALVHSHHPDALDFAKLNKSVPQENIQLAFSVAEKVMGIPRLLDPADLGENIVDENLIVVYLSFFVKYDPTKKKELPTPSPTTTVGPSELSVQPLPTATHSNAATQQHTTTTSSPQSRESAPEYPTTTLFRRRLMDIKDPIETLPRYFFEREALSADDDVIFFKREAQWKRKNWSQCGSMVRRAARALITLEVQPGDRVCIFGKTRYEWMAFYIAALTVGAVPVSIGSSFSSKQDITHILNHSEASVLLLEKQSQFKKVKGLSKSLQYVKHIITREKDSGKKGLSWRQFLRQGENNKEELDEEIKKRLAILTPDTVATLVYSPGTEGERNGIFFTHRNLLWTARQFCRQTGITGDDSYVSFLSMSHITEQIMAIVLPVIVGLQVYYARDITCLSDTLKEAQPSVFVAPPEYWFTCYVALKTSLPPTGLEGLSEILLDQVRKSIGCGRVQVAVVGGNSQPCPLEVYTFFASLGITLLQSYGQLETTGLVTLNPADPSKARFNTVGKPIEGTEIQIASDGEILVKGPNLFQSYYKAAELTSKVVVDGWYHTGDVGKLDEDGYLCFDGRRSDAIHLSDGQVIMPLQLETDLRAAPLTKYAITVGEGKEHAGVLLILDNVVAKKLAKKKGTSPKRLLNNAEVQNQIKQHVETVSKAHNVKIRRFSIYPRSLSVKKGELTYTMSLRRKHIYEHFASYIENLYTQKDGAKAGLDMVANEAFKKSASMEDTKTTPKKITDGCFYRKTAAGEYKKTDLKQSEVEDMERQLVLAMKEIRELAKRIKTLQEQHMEDVGVIEGREKAINQMASHLAESDEDGKKGKKRSGDSTKKKKGEKEAGKDGSAGKAKGSKKKNPH